MSIVDVAKLSLAELHDLKKQIKKETHKRKVVTELETIRQNISSKGFFITYPFNFDDLPEDITYEEIKLPIRFISTSRSRYQNEISKSAEPNDYDTDNLPKFIDLSRLPCLKSTPYDQIIGKWDYCDYDSPYTAIGNQKFCVWVHWWSDEELEQKSIIHTVSSAYVRNIYVKGCGGYAKYVESDHQKGNHISIHEALTCEDLNNTYIIHENITYNFVKLTDLDEIFTNMIIK